MLASLCCSVCTTKGYAVSPFRRSKSNSATRRRASRSQNWKVRDTRPTRRYSSIRPSSARISRVGGWVVEARGLSSILSFSYRRRTLKPRRAQARAATVPTGPAPTTMTFRRCIFRRDYTDRRRSLMKRLAILLLLVSSNALAQTWPQKPVKVVVPFPPGGVTDAIARITADWLGPRLGQAVIAENRPGASGAIAAEFVARADADGYTLFSAATPQLAIVPHVQKISYDPLKDFAPISIVGTNPFALGCNANLPPKSLTELVAYSKERPGQLSYASPGSGSVGHLTMALFLARAGLKMEAVLYKGGGPAIADVVAGHVPCYFGNLNEIIPHAGSGRLKVFAVSSERRAPQLPQVPTVAEQGYPGFRTVTWNGYVAPAGTPRPVVERIAREIAAACKDAAFVERLAKIGVDPACSTPEDFAKAIGDDLNTWKEAVQAAGIK